MADPKRDQRICALIDALADLHMVVGVRRWIAKNGGRERVYVTLKKRDGGRYFRGGVGHVVYVDVNTGFVCVDTRHSWAGPRTQAYHQEQRTMQVIRFLVKRHLGLEA